MYTLLLLLLLGLAAFWFVSGIGKRKTGRIYSGVLLGALTLFFFWFMGFWGEMLWFESIGYNDRFWTEILAKLGFLVVGAFVGWIVVFLLTSLIPKEKKYTKLISRVLGAFIGALVVVSSWDVILRYVNRVPANIADPILGQDAGFYLFSLPFYDMLYNLFVVLALIGLGASLSAIFLRVRQQEINIEYPSADQFGTRTYQAMFLNGAILIFLLAVGKYLARFHLMYSQWGAVTGPGWTDVHVRLPAYIITIIVTVAIGIFLLIPAFRKRAAAVIQRSERTQRPDQPMVLFGAGVAIFVAWFLLLTVIPGLFQWLRVEPNEITVEEPYIENNIEFTRYGFKLHEVEEREFPAAEQFNQQMVQQNQGLFQNIRLWDYRALDAVYKQFQEIRLYYEFVDVDIDRYHINDSYRQVMVSAREMEFGNLPQQSQTFINKRFKYTHGYGITLTTVNEFTPQGLPNLLIKDIPPKNEYASLKVEEPAIYYGELSDTHVIVNSKEEEFDYPSGEQNIYTHYSGTGGVQISNLWRKFLFGWKFDGTRLFVSSYPTRDSRIMFHRQIQNRVQKLAPFLTFDKDPYIALVEGKLYWIIEAYTTSEYFPYSEPFTAEEYIEYREGPRTRVLTGEAGYNLSGSNYVRNSVKIIIDAFNGNVDFYIYDEDDPVVQVWANIFPDMFKSKDDMPPDVQEHVRYPIDMLLVQGLVYAKYHMTDPAVFYNQEDLWIRATEKYYNRVQPVEPYYIMWELPDSDELDYSLILPFTPKNRQVMIGWIAGLCDGENYGRFLAYKFPKEKRILGPQQVETKIDQDSYLSGQLSLWDQRGSNVIRGNVLVIPVDETLIYVEPIYLQAETAAYPELRLVAVMHGDDLSYAETFDQALRGLFQEGARELPDEGLVAGEITGEELIQQANTAFQDYLRLLGEKNYQQAGEALQRLEQSLQQLSEQGGAE